LAQAIFNRQRIMALILEAADALVVGAGPAGIAAVLALRERGLRRIAWVDPAFDSGRLSLFRSVACNTKLDLVSGPSFLGHRLMRSAGQDEVDQALKQLVATGKTLPWPLDDPAELGWTMLGACKDVYDVVTALLLKSTGVEVHKGRVAALEHESNTWVAALEDSAVRVPAHAVVFATGAVPRRTVGVSGESLCDEDALRAAVAPGSSVAVLGNSHTAAVVLAKLFDLPDDVAPGRVANFAKRDCRLAEWVPEAGGYRYTSTGLKGFGAAFGREFMKQNSQSKRIELHPADTLAPDDWNLVVDCTGYVASPLPAVAGASISHERDELSGRLLGAEGLYAVGAPWGEPAGRFWGKGREDEEGFKGEGSFIGFHLFFDRAEAIAEEVVAELALKKLAVEQRLSESSEPHSV